jgi:hypothetical protein
VTAVHVGVARLEASLQSALKQPFDVGPKIPRNPSSLIPTMMSVIADWADSSGCSLLAD